MWISDDGFTHCVILPLFSLDSIENKNQKIAPIPMMIFHEGDFHLRGRNCTLQLWNCSGCNAPKLSALPSIVHKNPQQKKKKKTSTPWAADNHCRHHHCQVKNNKTEKPKDQLIQSPDVS
jgi:hypothetical protein